MIDAEADANLRQLDTYEEIVDVIAREEQIATEQDVLRR